MRRSGEVIHGVIFACREMSPRCWMSLKEGTAPNINLPKLSYTRTDTNSVNTKQDIHSVTLCWTCIRNFNTIPPFQYAITWPAATNEKAKLCWRGGWGGGGGNNRGRRDLIRLEFRAFPLPPEEKGEQILKKWSKCTGRWAARAAGVMPRVARVSHDWCRHQRTPERLLMKQLPRISLLPDSVLFFFFIFSQTLLSEHYERAQTRWWQP